MLQQNKKTDPILLIDLAKNYGGAEVRVLDTAKLLHGQHPYAVATLANSPLHQRLEAANLVSLPVPFSRGDPRLLFFFRRAIRQGGYKVVDAHNVQSQFWGHLAATFSGNISKISTIHSAYKLEHNHSRKGRLYEQVIRFNKWLGIKFIAVSEAVYKYLRETGIPPGKISLIHNSITLPPSGKQQKATTVPNFPEWGKDTTIVIVVARLEPVKGHTFLLEALSKLAQKRPQLRCLFVGEGRTREALEAQITAANLEDRVHITGFRNDIPDLLQASDVFCLPSLSEGLPYALLEACALHMPALVTKVGGMAELLTHKQTAYLVPPSDAAALAEGLEWLLDHPQETAALGEAGFEWLRENFNPDEMIADTLAVYQGSSAK